MEDDAGSETEALLAGSASPARQPGVAGVRRLSRARSQGAKAGRAPTPAPH